MRLEKSVDQLYGPQVHYGINLQIGLTSRWEKTYNKFIALVVVFHRKTYVFKLFFNKSKKVKNG